MSSLATKLESAPPPPGLPPHGPRNLCFPLYGAGDLEDFAAVEALRETRTWAQVQAAVDAAAGVEKPLPPDKFRYHWRRKCYCWPAELRG